jgi:hypothetical protein
MNATALALVPDANIPSERVEMRRFMTADLSRHGVWLIPRMLKVYPELTEQSAVGWVKGFVTSNEYLFLQQDNGVALAQLMPGYSLVPTQIVQERFVWVADPKNQEQVEHAADFYSEMYQWANRLTGVKDIIVDENTDVPRAMIEKCMTDHKCRLLKREMSYVRVKER